MIDVELRWWVRAFRTSPDAAVRAQPSNVPPSQSLSGTTLPPVPLQWYLLDQEHLLLQKEVPRSQSAVLSYSSSFHWFFFSFLLISWFIEFFFILISVLKCYLIFDRMNWIDVKKYRGPSQRYFLLHHLFID